MQDMKVNSLGFRDLVYSVPSTVEEFDRLAGVVGAALSEGINNVLYRSSLASFRDGFCHGIEAVKDEQGNVTTPAIPGLDTLTGIERKTKVSKPEKKNDAGEVTQQEVLAWDETEGVYVDRVFAQLVADGKFPSIDAAQASFAEHAQLVLSAIVFDPKPTVKSSAGPKKTPKTYVDIAKSIIELCGGDVNAAIEKFTAKTNRKLETQDEAGLAKAIWEDQTAQRKAIAAGYAS